MTSDLTGPSIKSALAGIKQDDDPSPAMQQHLSFSKTTEDIPLTEEKLMEKWAEYVESIRERSNLMVSLNREPLFSPDGKLILRIDNLVQEELVRNEKPRLVAWLRRELGNSSIELTTEVVSEPVQRVAYTDGEKLAEMLRKNQALELLKQRFNLDFDS